MYSEATKKVLMVTTVTFFVIIFFCIYLINQIYSSIFRVTPIQVSSYLQETDYKCETISECELLPGDILIRRYITSRTQVMDRMIDPYFTHSSFYLGSDTIVEAVGEEKNSEDEIKIVKLSESDWFNSNIDSFVIIRPINYSSKIDKIIYDLKNIAEDPDYVFGLPKTGQKRATCADLIFQQLLSNRLIENQKIPRIITPDYLFWALKNSTNFKIIGYKVK